MSRKFTNEWGWAVVDNIHDMVCSIYDDKDPEDKYHSVCNLKIYKDKVDAVRNCGLGERAVRVVVTEFDWKKDMRKLNIADLYDKVRDLKQELKAALDKAIKAKVCIEQIGHTKDCSKFKDGMYKEKCSCDCGVSELCLPEIDDLKKKLKEV